MLTALFILTFLVGFFLGALALVAVCTILVQRNRRNPYISSELLEEHRRKIRDSQS